MLARNSAWPISPGEWETESLKEKETKEQRMSLKGKERINSGPGESQEAQLPSSPIFLTWQICHVQNVVNSRNEF